jgi:CDP-glycerol glycerophosphotransferase (TagB/SpsB family)
LHPFVANLSKNIEKLSYVIDVSDYYDSEELVAASDILITDYSSIMFEPAFVKKPVFLLATDRERYLREERGFLIDYDTLPFPIAESNEDLAEAIRKFSMEKYIQEMDAFMEKYGVHEDGHAGERAAKFILDLLDGKRS